MRPLLLFLTLLLAPVGSYAQTTRTHGITVLGTPALPPHFKNLPYVNPDAPNEIDNNNYKARPITVLLTPPPDLVVTSVVPTAQAVGGDPFTVRWTVQNHGQSATMRPWLEQALGSRRSARCWSSDPGKQAVGSRQAMRLTEQIDGYKIATA